MNNKTVRFNVSVSIKDGKLEAFEELAQAMVAGSRKEPGTLTYDWYLSGDRKQCRLVEIYVDANAALAHLTGPVVTELVPKAIELGTITNFEVCGDPGAKASEMLAGFGAQIFKPWHGLS